jgi:hypothetical protein
VSLPAATSAPPPCRCVTCSTRCRLASPDPRGDRSDPTAPPTPVVLETARVSDRTRMGAGDDEQVLRDTLDTWRDDIRVNQ